jgi:hypothetical protein
MRGCFFLVPVGDHFPRNLLEFMDDVSGQACAVGEP